MAHSVSVMTLQIGGLRRQLGDVLADRTGGVRRAARARTARPRDRRGAAVARRHPAGAGAGRLLDGAGALAVPGRRRRRATCVRPASTSSWRCTAPRASCPARWTCRPTGSSRRRSPTCCGTLPAAARGCWLDYARDARGHHASATTAAGPAPGRAGRPGASRRPRPGRHARARARCSAAPSRPAPVDGGLRGARAPPARRRRTRVTERSGSCSSTTRRWCGSACAWCSAASPTSRWWARRRTAGPPSTW